MLGIDLLYPPEVSFKVVRWLPHILKPIPRGLDMKKLKRKHKPCAKNVRFSKASMEDSSSKFLKVLTFFSRILSIYKSARELGWLDGLPALMEKISAVIRTLYFLFVKHM